MSEVDGLRRLLPELLRSLGVRALGEPPVRVSPGGLEYKIRLALPPKVADVTVEVDDIHNPDGFMKTLENGARVLFRDVVNHIAEHDRSPIERVETLEKHARALLEALDIGLNDIRMPFGAASKVQNAAHDLAQLLKAKPGAATWARNGYGKDPK